MKRKHILALVAVLLIAASFYLYRGGATPAGQSPLTSLEARNISEIRSQFNAASDRARVLLLLSPT
ncbi:MAG TPA: hypothetical protein VKS01_03480 [Bryobacteraceae bacterium]|nr:hypothetical protein [Bryobacteraceae bacterium]